MRQTYGKLLPGMKLSDLAGKLIVIEGTDGAGRTTQINMLKPWLEQLGHAVLDTGMTRSPLAGDGIRRAKEGNNLGRVTQSLFYATDFIDRLENEIAPALRAGFVVLTDRYIYSLMARAHVRGVSPAWVKSLYSVALKPDAIFYLRVGIEELIPRVVFSRGFDYWESGMDLFPRLDMFESYCNYQKALLAEFDRLSEHYKFDTVDAAADPRTVLSLLQERILKVLDPSRHRPVEAVQNPMQNMDRGTRASAESHSDQADTATESYVAKLVFRPFVASLRHSKGSNGNGNGHSWAHGD
ncbi:MAG TPA: thymidylate kinase [Candidatus Acidoferrales bacterium]|jgi:dTMP kinase|nr:thymidylate kinase [Candidatus Acidoferrales bacterium]